MNKRYFNHENEVKIESIFCLYHIKDLKLNNTHRPVNIHSVYHAHIYFDHETLNLIHHLYHILEARFKTSIHLGKIHQKLVGPHSKWSCQITFQSDLFDEFIPWLDKNRGGLSVLVHGLSGNNLRDHSTYAYWLGDSIDVYTEIFIDN